MDSGTVAPSFAEKARMRFRILGPLEALDGARAVSVGAAKPRALLGVLLLHANEVVSTARLVDELWGDEPPTTARKLVQGYVHALRKQLGPEPRSRTHPATACASIPTSWTCSSFGG